MTGCGVAIELLGFNAQPLLTFSANIGKVYMYMGFQMAFEIHDSIKIDKSFQFYSKVKRYSIAQKVTTSLYRVSQMGEPNSLHIKVNDITL